jgi:predicted transcriptional regulator
MKKVRRSRFEILMIFLEVCVNPGASCSTILNKANINHSVFHELLFGLLDDHLINVETRPNSVSGQKRETDYFLRTPKGDQLINDFKELRSRLTRAESPSG